MARIIRGERLLGAAKALNLTPEYIAQIDPHGVNVIGFDMPHNGFEERRIILYTKVRGSNKPVEAVLTIKTSLYNKIVQNVRVPND